MIQQGKTTEETAEPLHTITEHDILLMLLAYESCKPMERKAVIAFLDKNVAYLDRTKAMKAAGYSDSYIRRERAPFWRREHVKRCVEFERGAVAAPNITPEAFQRDLEDLWTTGSKELKTRLAPFMAKQYGVDAAGKLEPPIWFTPDETAQGTSPTCDGSAGEFDTAEVRHG